MPEAEKPKVYELTSAETRGITFRNTLSNHYDYLTNLIKQDLSIYVNRLMKEKGVGLNEELLRLDVATGQIITMVKPEPKKEEKTEDVGKSKKHKN